jgi:hypothetical protein
VASVVLDIGHDAGALVLYTPRTLNGAEVEIRRLGTAWRGEHTAVRERRVLGGTRFAGVFGSLPGGTYQLRLKGTPRGDPRPVLTVDVTDGSVTEATLQP